MIYQAYTNNTSQLWAF